MLRRADPAINEDIENLTKHIESDLSAITDKHYYQKQYNKIKEDYEKAKAKRLKEQTLATAETEQNKREDSDIKKSGGNVITTTTSGNNNNKSRQLVHFKKRLRNKKA